VAAHEDLAATLPVERPVEKWKLSRNVTSRGLLRPLRGPRRGEEGASAPPTLGRGEEPC
jgi:hypothetical protein